MKASGMDSSKLKQDTPTSKPQMHIGEEEKISQNVKYQHGEQWKEQHDYYDSTRASLEEHRSPISDGPDPLPADCDKHREAASPVANVSPYQRDEHNQTAEVSSKYSQSHLGGSKPQCKNKNLYNLSKSAVDETDTSTDVSGHLDSGQMLNISEHCSDLSGASNWEKKPGRAVRVDSSEEHGAEASMNLSDYRSRERKDGGRSHSYEDALGLDERQGEGIGGAGNSSSQNDKYAESDFKVYQYDRSGGHDQRHSGGGGYNKYTREGEFDSRPWEEHKGNKIYKKDRKGTGGHDQRHSGGRDSGRHTRGEDFNEFDLRSGEGHKGNRNNNNEWSREEHRGNKEYKKDGKGTGGHDKRHSGGRGQSTAHYTRGDEELIEPKRGNSECQTGNREHNKHRKGDQHYGDWHFVDVPHKSKNKGHDTHKGDEDGRVHHGQHKGEGWYSRNRKEDKGYNKNRHHKGDGRDIEHQKGHGENHSSGDKFEYGHERKDGSSTKLEKGEDVLEKKNAAKAKAMNWKTYEDEGEDEDKEYYQNPKEREALTKYEYFWKDKDIYSQWHKSFFTVNRKEFAFAEQFMMYKKAELFEDWKIAKQVLKADHPRTMKSLGRKVKNFSEAVWADSCLYIVKEANIAKFSQKDYLKEQLFSTYPKVLVEASPYDKMWGIGLMKDWPDAWDKSQWKGKNLLGYIITEVRDELMCEAGLIPEEVKLVYLEDLKQILLEDLDKKTSGTSVDGFHFDKDRPGARQSDTTGRHAGTGVREADDMTEHKYSSEKISGDDTPEWAKPTKTSEDLPETARNQEQDNKAEVAPEWVIRKNELDNRADISKPTKTSEDLPENARNQEQDNKAEVAPATKTSEDDIPKKVTSQDLDYSGECTASNRIDEKEEVENDVSKVSVGSHGVSEALVEAKEDQTEDKNITAAGKFEQKKDCSLIPESCGSKCVMEGTGMDSDIDIATSDIQSNVEGAKDFSKTLHLSDIEMTLQSCHLVPSEDNNVPVANSGVQNLED